METLLNDNSLKPDPLSRALIEIVWQFGGKGANGECCEDLSMPEYLALETAACNDDCPVQMIGQKIGFTKSGATRIVNRLEKKGYVRKVRSLENARFCCVMPTKKGKQAYMRMTASFEKRLHTVLEKTGQGQSEAIADAIRELAAVLNRER